MTEVYIYDVLRTPRGKGRPSGALYEVKPVHLLEVALRALQQRTGFEAADLDDVIIGCVTPVGDQGFNIARTALLEAEMKEARGGLQVNRLCTSGLEAINLGAAKIATSWDQMIVAGGTESMSRVPMGSDGGALMNDPAVMIKQKYIPQGVAADLIATIEGFDREMIDNYALTSQQRANQAITKGYFEKSLVPICDLSGLTILDADEIPRPATTLETLGRLKPAFSESGKKGFDAIAMQRYPEVNAVAHLHTAGNSSTLADGASLVLLGNEAAGQKLNIKPRARIVSSATASVDPTIMLTGAGDASLRALAKAGLQKEDIDLWECNEAFASVVLKFQKDLDLSPDIVNVNGGAIALGHPLGATGAMLLGSLLDELERQNLKRGLVAICAGGGLAVATIIERV